MKKFFYSFLFILSIFLNSCSQDVNVNMPPIWPYIGYYQPYVTNTNGQYIIGGYINGQTTRSFTRSMLHEGEGASYDNFTLYVYTPDSTIMNPYHGVFSGNTWGYTENLKYFDNFVSEYGFIGIIPESANQTYDESNHSVTVEANAFTVENENSEGYTDTKEILYATTNVSKENYPNGATLSFNHANAKVYLKFKSNDPNTQIIDYSPYNPGSPEVPATSGTITTETRQSKVIDELVAGNIVGWPYAVDANLSSTQANNFYNGINRENNNGQDWLAANWLSSLANDVNSQFEYYDENGNKINPDNTSWKWPIDNTLAQGATSNNKKNKIFFKLKDSVNKEDFANGNDVFWNTLCEHENDWSNGSASLKDIFKKSYDEGWRVIRIGYISNWNSSGQSVGTCVWLVNNTQMTLTVTTITGGTEYQPAVPATGKEGIIVLPAISELQDGTDAILSNYPTNANITVSVGNPLVWESTDFNNSFIFTKPEGTLGTNTIKSPTTWFTFPKVSNNIGNLGFTVKFSFIYKGVTVYDARIYIPSNQCNWEEGKYYEYIININGRGNGHDTIVDPNGIDPIIENPILNEITVNPIINPYIYGETYEYTIQ